MFRKVIALLTATSLAWSSVCVAGQVRNVEEDEEGAIVMRTIVSRGESGWAIADIREISGKLVVISPRVGADIDLEESNRFGLFQGRTTYNQRVDIDLLDISQEGFLSAVFMTRSNGKPAVKIQFRFGPRTHDKMIPLKDDNELRRIREYIEHIVEIRAGKYDIQEESQIDADAEYPMVTDDTVSFELTRPRFMLASRTSGEVVLKDGEKVQGELVPVYEDGRIMVQAGLDTRWIPVSDIARVRLIGDKGTHAMKTAVTSGIGSAAGGALAGAFAAWQTESSVKSYALFGAVFFGVAGFITGFLTGARTAKGGGDYVLGPVEPKDARKGKKE